MRPRPYALTILGTGVERRPSTDGAVDAEVLQRMCSSPFLLKTSKRCPMSYAPGTLDSAALKAKYAAQPEQALFELPAVTPDQLMHTADQGGFYHPKAPGLNRNYGVDCLSMDPRQTQPPFPIDCALKAALPAHVQLVAVSKTKPVELSKRH